jgi:hypothetical protein
MPNGNGGWESAKSVLDTIAKIVILGLIPFMVWVTQTINSHTTDLAVINSNRFTSEQGAEVTLLFTQAITELQGTVNLIGHQQDEMRSRIERLERGGVP